MDFSGSYGCWPLIQVHSSSRRFQVVIPSQNTLQPHPIYNTLLLEFRMNDTKLNIVLTYLSDSILERMGS